MKNFQMTPYKLFLLLFFTQVGISVFSLPLALYEVSKHNAWIPIALAGMCSQIALTCIWYVGTKLKVESFADVYPKLFGKIAGTGANFAFAAYFLVLTGILVRYWTDLSKTWIYFQTPFWFLALLFLLLTLYLARGGLRAISTYSPICLAGVLLFLLLLSTTIPDMQKERIMPIGRIGWGPATEGTVLSLTAMIGFELLWFLQPYVDAKPIRTLRSATAANMVTVVFTLLVMVSTVMFFGDEEYALVSHPILYQLKSQAFIIAERTDLLILTLWVTNLFLTSALFLYIASQLVHRSFKKIPEKWLLYGLTGAIFCAVFSANAMQLDQKLQDRIVLYAGILMAYLFPILGLAVYGFRHGLKGGRR